jgi:hypothetical protein
MDSVADWSVWSCLLCLLISLIFILITLFKPPWKPVSDAELALADAPQIEMQQRREERARRTEMERISAHSHGQLFTPLRNITARRRWRPSMRVCVVLHACGLILFIITLGIDIWSIASISAMAPQSPSSPKLIPVLIPMQFGLGSRRVSPPIGNDGVWPTDVTAFQSGSYSQICKESRSILGCSVGFQIGAVSVAVHAMITVASAVILLCYFFMATRCNFSVSHLMHLRQFSLVTGQTRKSVLGVTWRVALIGTIALFITPWLWFVSAHTSLRKNLQSPSNASVGVSWIMALLLSLLSPLFLWVNRRSLQLLHADRSRLFELHMGPRDSPISDIDMEHAYHRQELAGGSGNESRITGIGNVRNDFNPPPSAPTQLNYTAPASSIGSGVLSDESGGYLNDRSSMNSYYIAPTVKQSAAALLTQNDTDGEEERKQTLTMTTSPYPYPANMFHTTNSSIPHSPSQHSPTHHRQSSPLTAEQKRRQIEEDEIAALEEL